MIANHRMISYDFLRYTESQKELPTPATATASLPAPSVYVMMSEFWLNMLYLLTLDTVYRVASYLDATQVYLFHHTSRDHYRTIHEGLVRLERARREWERQHMRLAERDRTYQFGPRELGGRGSSSPDDGPRSDEEP